MDIISFTLSSTSQKSFFIALVFTLLGLFLALLAVRSRSSKPRRPQSDGSSSSNKNEKLCNCFCHCNGGVSGSDSEPGNAPHLNGGTEKQTAITGASMMEQLVPEITTHALSYLDYPSLCRLSMTNSHMRKAANDDNAWKALYHKVWYLLGFPLFLSFISSFCMM